MKWPNVGEIDHLTSWPTREHVRDALSRAAGAFASDDMDSVRTWARWASEHATRIYTTERDVR
jgi:hypothetical protein